MNKEIENAVAIEDDALEDVAGGLSLGGAAVTEGAENDRSVRAATSRARAETRGRNVRLRASEEKVAKSEQVKASVAKTVKNSKDAAVI